MAKRKKHPRLPNSFGSVRYLGKNRTNPYAVHPPATDTDIHGNYIRPKALCYVDDWYVGFAVLNAYHAGNYTPGDEIKFKSYRPADEGKLDSFCKRLLTDFTAHAYVKTEETKNEKTFAEVYTDFYEWKFDENRKKKYANDAKSTKNALQSAFKNFSSLHAKAFRGLRHEDYQHCLDTCTLKEASIKHMMTLIKQMYRFAEMNNLSDKDYSRYLVMPNAEACERGVPFSDDELAVLWKNKNDTIAMKLLIMCYSGYRITAYESIKINREKWYFKGGVKTAAGKDRIVPIHSLIQPLVLACVASDGCILPEGSQTFRDRMYRKLAELGLERHTPHDCRHTFSRLCEKYEVSDNDRKRMLGHSFSGDITNEVYGHRTLEDLREQIEKIKCDYLVSSKSPNKV